MKSPSTEAPTVAMLVPTAASKRFWPAAPEYEASLRTRTHRECDNQNDASCRDFDHRTKWQEGKAGQLFELIEDARLDLLMKVAHLAACGEGGDDSERR